MRMTIALDEALRNALFHGNLEVSSDLREKDERQFHELAAQRALQSPYQDRRIAILIAHNPDLSRFVIRDDGPGFDTSRAQRPIEPEDLLRSTGRGLLLMKSFMDSVTFNDAGNEVILVKRRPTDSLLRPLVKPGGTMEYGSAQAVGSVLPSTLVQRKNETVIKGTAPGVNGDRKPEAVLSAALNGLVPLEFDFYKRLLDQLHDAVYFVDKQRTILYWNGAAERLTGFTASEVVGKRCFDGFLEPCRPFRLLSLLRGMPPGAIDEAGRSVPPAGVPAAQGWTADLGGCPHHARPERRRYGHRRRRGLL